jgi:hypothetical protein
MDEWTDVQVGEPHVRAYGDADLDNCRSVIRAARAVSVLQVSISNYERQNAVLTPVAKPPLMVLFSTTTPV